MDTNKTTECNPVCLQYRKDMLLVTLMGIAFLMIAGSGAASLLLLVWWSLTHDLKDIAIVIGFAGSVLGFGATIAAYLMPSPIGSHSAQQRRTDAPAGTPADPISTEITNTAKDAVPVTPQTPEPEGNDNEGEEATSDS